MGSTPAVRLRSVRPRGGAELWLKLELLNPSGSVEDRAAAALVDGAPAGGPVALAAAPNLAIAVALAARARGRGCAVGLSLEDRPAGRTTASPWGGGLTRPPTREQREMLRLLGAELREQAPEVDATAALRASLGPEVAALARAEPRLALVVAPAHLARALEGAGVPVPVEVAGDVPEEEAWAMASRLAREEGLLVGPATGAGVAAALRAAERRPASEAVLAFALDGGERYFSAAMEWSA